jgi:hypothetical protein
VYFRVGTIGYELQAQNLFPGTNAIYSIFLCGFEGDVAAVRKLIASTTMSSDYYLRPLVRISKASSDSLLLRLCFENGFSGTGYLDSERLLSSRRGNNPTTAWLDVLFDFDFRQWRTNPQQLSEWRSWRHIIFMGADCVRWWIEHGGRTLRARGIFELQHRNSRE